LIGTTLDGKYQIVRLLGEGGMGAVYEAVHVGTLERVAVKVVARRLLEGGPRSASRFWREAEASGALDDPHIVRTFHAGRDAATGDLYLAMERLVGEDLHHLLARVGPLRPDVALRVAAQALSGLVHAHAAGVVHRDIKPANLFLARGGDGEITVKILDFGLATIWSGALTANLTRTGDVFGSPHYMAPEQAEGLRDVDGRADVWSLGCTLYHALSGRAPLSHIANLRWLIVAICATPAEPLETRAPWVPPEVAAIVRRSLEIDRALRCPSAAAMLEAIAPLVPAGAAIREEELVGAGPDAGRALAGDETTISSTVLEPSTRHGSSG
jgi:eukaryotic-like serine/threonine-protein kinase